MALFKNLKKALIEPETATTLKLTVSTNDLPEDLFKLTNLETLYIQSKKLSLIQARIGELNKLRVLYITSPTLSIIPNEVLSLPQLETLSLTGCNLTSFDLQIGSPTKFHTLLINKNKLQEIPSGLDHLESLNSLNLSDNDFDSFPHQLLNLEKLNKLYLDRNKLKELPIDKIKAWKSLNLLSLDGNLFDETNKELIQEKLNYWFGEI